MTLSPDDSIMARLQTIVVMGRATNSDMENLYPTPNRAERQGKSSGYFNVEMFVQHSKQFVQNLSTVPNLLYQILCLVFHKLNSRDLLEFIDQFMSDSGIICVAVSLSSNFSFVANPHFL